MNSPPVPARPWSERIADGSCLVFAAWTLACHAAVAAGASLWAAAAGVAALLVGLWLAWSRLPAGGAAPAATSVSAPSWEPAVRGVALLAACCAAWFLDGKPLALWWAAVGLLGAGSLVALRPGTTSASPPARSMGLEVALWSLAAACAVLALTVQRPDLDDAFYLNVAVAAVDEPRAALFAGDTLHGIAGLPVHHPIYRVHTWELWNALWSATTGVPVIAMFHWVSAALAAALVPLAWARLFRRLTPGYWLAVVGVVVFVLLVVGDTHRGYGNFGFVRIWQGKAVFLTALVPLIAAFAIDFMRAPSWRGGVLLAAGQVAALGCTSSALWAAPAVALSAAAAALAPGRAGMRRLALAASTSLYVLGVGVALQLTLADDLDARRHERDTAAWQAAVADGTAQRELRHRPGLQLDEALTSVLGEGPVRPLALAALLGTWALLPAGLGRRYACVVPLATWLILLNPYASDAVSRYVVGNSSWRAFWALPIPALLALALSATLGWGLPRALAAGATLLACGLFALAPIRTTLAAANDVRVDALGYKVTDAYRIAELFHARVPAGASVVAPRAVAVWLPTFPGRSHPLLVRDPYLRRFRAELGPDDLYHRLLMTEFVSGVAIESDAARHFARGLERYSVRGVLLTVSPQAAAARKLLREAGFEKVLATLEFEIWTRG